MSGGPRRALAVLREEEAALRELLARGRELLARGSDRAVARDRGDAAIAAIAGIRAEIRALAGADRAEARRLALSILELHACLRDLVGRELARTSAAIERTRAASAMLGPERQGALGGSCDVEG